MSRNDLDQLSRREREILGILFEKQKASAAEVMEAMVDPPSYSGVRGLLKILEDKGHVRHVRQGMRFLYTPKHNRTSVAKNAISKLVKTYFCGSVESAVAALLDDSSRDLTAEEFDALEELIRQARKQKESEDA